ncbi:amino acid adenylation domain-containing protein [Streptomyces sp. NPDC059679]|uniref:amino acid adenylation domain-containing protein n=1 Tax=Streptomyces sp. NPDC059679 TaxID=3346903 RepID=UPI0036B28E51
MGKDTLRLTTEYPRPPDGAETDADRGEVCFRIDADLTAAVTQLAREAAQPPHSALLAAYAVLLSRHAGQTGFILGVHLAGKPEGMVPLRVDVSGAPSFTELLRRIDGALHEASARTHPPEPCPVAFAFSDGRPAHCSVPVAADDVPGPQPELSVELRPVTSGGLRGIAAYDARLFGRGTVRRLLSRYVALLRAAVADPHTSVAELPLPIDSDERRSGTADDTARECPTGTLVELVQAQPATSCAVRYHAAHLTYGELLARARSVAARLQRRGIGPGSLVAVCVERNQDMPAALLGVLLSGAAYLPLDPEQPAARKAYLLEDSGASVVLAEPHLQPTGRKALDLREALATESSDFQPPCIAAESTAYVLYTSGSTGRPKGVMVPHRALINFLKWARSLLTAGENHVWLALTSLSFDISALELYLPLISGGSCVIADADAARDGDAAARLIRDHGVTHVQATPSGWRVLLTGDVPPVVALVGGEPLPPALARRLRRRTTRLFNVYGPTETTIWSTVWEVPEDPGPIRIGRPVDNTTVDVLDTGGRPVPAGVRGDLCIGGQGVATGYLGRPALTAERFVPDPGGPPGARRYRTGDVVAWRPDGNLEFAGRSDDQVKLRGHRIELGEIEAVAEEFPDVQQAVATVRSERLVAFVVGRTDGLREHLVQRLPGIMVPADIIEVARLPLTFTGKVDRQALPEVPARRARQATPPRTALEALVAEVCTEALGGKTVGIHDDFFQGGGTSLSAAVAAAALRDRLGLQVPGHILFAHRTPALLADWLGCEARPARTAPQDTRRASTSHSLSPLQFRMWLSHALRPDNPVHTVPLVLDMHGRLDRAALRGALGDVVQRHTALRSLISETAEGPVATVLSGADALALPERVVSADAFDQHTDAVLRTPFDLSADLPFRVLLLTTGQHHRLVLAIHHIAVDGRSVAIILSELADRYVAHAGRAAADSTPPPAPDYGTAAEVQARALDDDLIRRQTAFWADYLKGAAPGPLPIDSRRTPAGVGGRCARSLGPEIREGVAALARQCGTTSFVVLLAAFGALLRRWSGREDVCVGVPVSRRDGPDFDRIVGFFINTVAVRVDLRGGPDFSTLVTRLGTQWARIQANADIPFDQMLTETGLERPFSVWFNHLGLPDTAPALPGLRTRIAVPPSSPAIYDLNVYLTDDGEQLEVAVVHDARTFQADLAAALLEQYVLLLKALVAAPDTCPDDIALSPGEPPVPRTATPRAGAAVARLARRVAEMGGALADSDGVLPAGAVHERAKHIAAAITSAGVAPGGTVAVAAARSRQLPSMLLGVWLAGCSYALLDPALPARSLTACLDAVAPNALLSAAEDGGAIQSALAGRRIVGEDIVLIRADDADYRLHLARAGAGSAAHPAGHVIFTSGTTTGPKAVVSGADPLVHFLEWYGDTFRLSAQDRFSFLSGLGHDPLHRDVFAPLWCGGTLHVPSLSLSASSAGQLAEWLAEQRITVAHLTPHLSRLLVSGAEAIGLRLPRLRLVCLGGDVITASDVFGLRRVAPRAAVVVGYGTTETPQLASYHVVDRRYAERWAARRGSGAPLPLGPGAPGARLAVTTVGGLPAAVGEVGEIVVRSRHLATGYLDPRLTGERFAPDPLPGVRRFATRDAGRRLPDGSVEFLGRLDDEVTIRGHRVSPAEVDAMLVRHPLVRASVTCGRRVSQSVGPGDLELVSYIVTRDGSPIAVSQVRAFLSPALPSPSLPTMVVHMDKLPLTGNGKVDRSSLPDPTPRPAGAGRTARTPITDDVEQLVSKIWASVLQLDRVGANDNFFDLGGTSARMTAVYAALREQLGWDISLLALYEHPTVGALAEHLRGVRPDPGPGSRRRTRYASDAERQRRLAARRGR